MSDLISRQAALDAISCDITITGRQNAELVAATIGTFADRIKALPSAQPDIDEWCTDCSEYDHDKHCCPRFNRVIHTALEDAQPERKTGLWIEMGQNDDGTHNICCGVCGKFKIKSKGHANSAYTKSKYRFCGGCGARMEADADE